MTCDTYSGTNISVKFDHCGAMAHFVSGLYQLPLTSRNRISNYSWYSESTHHIWTL